MKGETVSAPSLTGLDHARVARARWLPQSLLYSIFARIGGSGLDTDAFETLRAAHRNNFLGKAVAYDNRQKEIPARYIHSLRWHPVRLLSSLDRPYYYGAKKKYLDWVTSRLLRSGRFDLFHSWSGDCLRTLQAARELGIPSLLEIPTWHRSYGMAARAGAPAPVRRGWKEKLLMEKERYLKEYQLADLILVLSEKAAETFRAKNFPEEKLFYLPRGVDTARFKPGKRPEVFRAVFSGALIERKGIHHLLEAWHHLNLKNAELWLLGFAHEEAQTHLKRFWRDNIRLLGFAKNPEEFLSQSTIHVFPSRLEGSAKVTYEAAACGLPQITTRESGDVVQDGIEGLIVTPGDVKGIAEAISHLYHHPEIVERMSEAARRRVVENFTWHHFRERLLDAYETALNRRA